MNAEERYAASRQVGFVICQKCGALATEVLEYDGVLGVGHPQIDTAELGITAAESITWIEGEWPAKRYNALHHQCTKHGPLNAPADQLRLNVQRARRGEKVKAVRAAPQSQG